MTSGSLSLLEPSGPVQACNGIAICAWRRPQNHTNTPLCSNNQKFNRTQPRCLASNLCTFLKMIWICRNTRYVGCTVVACYKFVSCRSRWPRGLRRKSSAPRLLRSWVRIPPGIWMSVCCECCVLSGRGLCDGLITRPEESYRMWCVVGCDIETSWMRRPWPTGDCRAKKFYLGQNMIPNANTRHTST